MWELDGLSTEQSKFQKGPAQPLEAIRPRVMEHAVK